MTMAGVSPQQLQPLPLVCKYPAVLYLTPSSVYHTHILTPNPSLHFLSLPPPPPKGVQFTLLHEVLNISSTCTSRYAFEVEKEFSHIACF